MENKIDFVALGELLIDFTESGKSKDRQRLFEQNPGVLLANKENSEIVPAFKAMAVAAICVQKRGGIPAIPSRDEVKDFMDMAMHVMEYE